MSGRPRKAPYSTPQKEQLFIDRVSSGISKKQTAKGLTSENSANYAEYLLRDPKIRDAIIDRLQRTAVNWSLLLLRAKLVLKKNTDIDTDTRIIFNKKGEEVGKEEIPNVEPRIQVAAAKVILDTVPKLGMPLDKLAADADEIADKKTLVRAVNRDTAIVPAPRQEKPS